ncbi:MAG TPA: chloride channel protein [Blastocatellia bacterium]|nr:chloride channel protein [Blastocatellia bacterium]
MRFTVQRAQLRRKWYRIELRATRIIDRLGLPENQKLFLITLIVGAVCGAVAVAFHLLILAMERNIIRHVFLAHERGFNWKTAALTLLVPTLGGLLVGLLLQYWVPDARGSGIPQVKTAYFINYGRLPFKSAIGKAITSAISLGTGASIGREGPTVQICAAVSSFLGRFFGVSRRRLMELLPVGSAAAVAAAFNTPIAAVTFAFEEIIGDLNQRMLGGIVIAAVIASAISRAFEPGHLYPGVTAYGLQHPAELVFYLLLGAIMGGVAVFFSHTLLKLRLIFRQFRQIPLWLKPAIGGFIVGIVGLFAPQAMGGGYATLTSALQGRLPILLLLTLSVAKIVTTVVSYGSGGSGGIFAPSLFIGAMVGGTLGYVVEAAIPSHPTAPGAFALVGMGASFCGVIRAPITSVLIVFEMTQNYSLILPLMIANATSYLVAQRLSPTPIYEALLEQDGIRLAPAQPKISLHKLTASNVMTRDIVTLPANFTIREAIEYVMTNPHYGFPVVDGARKMVGFITRNDLRHHQAEGNADALLGDVAIKDVVTAHPDHPLDAVMLKLGERELSLLPVVSRKDLRQLLGIISMRDIVRAQARIAARERQQPRLRVRKRIRKVKAEVKVQPPAEQANEASTVIT